MALLLREKHVTELLDIETTIAAVEEALRDQAEGVATNRPRCRVAVPSSQLHVMSAGDRRLGVYGLKAYTASRKGARFLVLLYDSESGDMLAMIEADRLGQMRTGAASGVATKYMARESADTLGVYGAGWQAESQMMAVCAVRRIKTAKVYSRKRDRREAFARRMTALLRCDVTAVESPEDAARGCSIIITATTARTPVLEGKWVEPGVHINAVGSNFLSKAEIDVEAIGRASVVAVDSIEQSRMEAGDLVPAIERGIISWESVTELGRIVAGRERGRSSDSDITLFKSNGIALEDISTALRVYNLARERGIGDAVDLWSE
ncbi:MAG TPA: ornithine cyclodeaminase family protein [Blastocatellia bacterium]|jgi:ornithine cyclodeaminase/alanine dehydrogenase-like protein (mu-crystallin family)|nr:ornithine cyclodeaminase family protein [Blastocatellia bacterium]